MHIADQAALALSYREFKGDLLGYTEAHEYTTQKIAKPFYETAKAINNHKFAAFTDRELKQIIEAF